MLPQRAQQGCRTGAYDVVHSLLFVLRSIQTWSRRTFVVPPPSIDGEADAGAESLCAILQHAYDKADVPILEFVTEDEFCTLVTEVFQVLGMPPPPQLLDRVAQPLPFCTGG